MSEESYRRYFGYEYDGQVVPEAHVSLWGGTNNPSIYATIPNGTPTFEFNALYRGWNTGHYVVRWRVKLLKDYHFSNGLRFRVSVNYGAEEDASDSRDVVIPHKELQKLGKGHKFDQGQDLDLDLELEELAVVQPCENQRTAVVVTMSSHGGALDRYSGLEVQYVELIPFDEIDKDKSNKDQGT
ncbi:hypothetical protein BGX34_012210, partial [Mortierella sp. NVP85]